MDNSTQSSTPSQPVTPPAPPGNQPPSQPQPQGMSEDTKTLITILLLIFVFPIGLIVMWILPKWPLWVKLLVSLPITLLIGAILVGILLVAVNPSEQIRKAECAAQCQETGGGDACVQSCVLSPTPAVQ